MKNARIAFESARDGNLEVYAMNADGTEQRRLTNNPAREWFGPTDRQTCWSPDGKKIACYSERDGQGEIYVLNADGTERKRLTNNTGHDHISSWSYCQIR